MHEFVTEPHAMQQREAPVGGFPPHSPVAILPTDLHRILEIPKYSTYSSTPIPVCGNQIHH